MLKYDEYMLKYVKYMHKPGQAGPRDQAGPWAQAKPSQAGPRPQAGPWAHFALKMQEATTKVVTQNCN